VELNLDSRILDRIWYVVDRSETVALCKFFKLKGRVLTLPYFSKLTSTAFIKFEIFTATYVHITEFQVAAIRGLVDRKYILNIMEVSLLLHREY